MKAEFSLVATLLTIEHFTLNSLNSLWIFLNTATYTFSSVITYFHVKSNHSSDWKKKKLCQMNTFNDYKPKDWQTPYFCELSEILNFGILLVYSARMIRTTVFFTKVLEILHQLFMYNLWSKIDMNVWQKVPLIENITILKKYA